ncbi:MAG: hypothetical protein ACKO5R_04870 [Planctomycetaceae bacterium]
MSSENSAPGDSVAEIIALYKRDVDRSLLRAQLAKSVDERFRDVMRMQVAVEELRRAGREARRRR